MSRRRDLHQSEFNFYYAHYIQQVPEEASLLDALKEGQHTTLEFFTALPQDKQSYRYQKGKWTPKEIFIHLIDTERIFSYRALRFGRMDLSPLPGFEQDDYVLHGNVGKRSMESLKEEYASVRAATVSLFQQLSAESLCQKGEASGSLLSPRAAGFIIAGHEKHHIEIIKERYIN